ncbi:MAG: cytochrome c peroxidase [Ahrensia sp.]|nr:cytochrome c peroxidase [Ahrensia sp.]
MKKRNLSQIISVLSVLAMAMPTALALEFPKPATNADYVALNQKEVEIGQLLFWDPILSGNKNISCGTCHHPKFGTGDGVSLSMGEGGLGLGPKRLPVEGNVPEQRIPRNAPALFNLGAKEFAVMFHDGRLEADATMKSGLRTPLDDDMVAGFSGVLSAQSMFPVLSPDEMAGHNNENDVAKAVRQGLITGDGGAWDIISKRVSSIEQYQAMFKGFNPEIAGGKPIDFTDISDALAAFIAFEWRGDNSAFDRYLRGETALSSLEKTGMDLFYGDAGCSSCHSGTFQTDHGFHAMGVPQIGPGKAAKFENDSQDTGRMRVTGDSGDAYAFRTPSLRNVTMTAPYGHSGAYRDLRAFVESHVKPDVAQETYKRDQVVFAAFTPPKNDWAALNDKTEVGAIKSAATAYTAQLSANDVDALMAFLGSLADEKSVAGRLGIPAIVPSGLPVDVD